MNLLNQFWALFFDEEGKAPVDSAHVIRDRRITVKAIQVTYSCAIVTSQKRAITLPPGKIGKDKLGVISRGSMQAILAQVKFHEPHTGIGRTIASVIRITGFLPLRMVWPIAACSRFSVRGKTGRLHRAHQGWTTFTRKYVICVPGARKNWCGTPAGNSITSPGPTVRLSPPLMPDP
jgi:hypothetical protein